MAANYKIALSNRVIKFASFLVLAAVTAPSQALIGQEETQKTRETEACLHTDDISDYKVMSDNTVLFRLVSQGTAILRVENRCPDLGYHKYVSYIPVNGRLCAKINSVFTRTGQECLIETIEVKNSKDEKEK